MESPYVCNGYGCGEVKVGVCEPRLAREGVKGRVSGAVVMRRLAFLQGPEKRRARVGLGSWEVLSRGYV